MIERLSTISFLYNNYSPSNIVSKKISVPVRPILASSLVFEHVIGVPARTAAAAVPSFKLRALDSFIDHVTRLNGKNTAPAIEKKADNENIDALIFKLGDRIHRTLSVNPAFYSGLIPEAGSIISLYA